MRKGLGTEDSKTIDRGYAEIKGASVELSWMVMALQVKAEPTPFSAGRQCERMWNDKTRFNPGLPGWDRFWKDPTCFQKGHGLDRENEGW